MAKINTYPKLTSVNPSDLLIITDVTSSENPTRNVTVQELTNALQLGPYPTFYVMNGLVNNLASTTGGYDYMEWTSNVTGPDQIPVVKTTDKLQLMYVTWAWMGELPVTIGPGEAVDFSIGTFADNVKTDITNYVQEAAIFSITSLDNNTFVSGSSDLSGSNIIINKDKIMAVVGLETGSLTPNDGELSISFKFKVV
tara:strand:- start:2944 stop:3534 length:591 start_codon:yes stop_codon:yes gene_type:complete